MRTPPIDWMKQEWEKYKEPSILIFIKLQIMTFIKARQMPKAIKIVDVSLACPEMIRAHVKSIPQTQLSRKVWNSLKLSQNNLATHFGGKT